MGIEPDPVKDSRELGKAYYKFYSKLKKSWKKHNIQRKKLGMKVISFKEWFDRERGIKRDNKVMFFAGLGLLVMSIVVGFYIFITNANHMLGDKAFILVLILLPFAFISARTLKRI